MNTELIDEYDLFCFDLDGTLISSYMDREDKDFHKWEPLPGRVEMIETLRNHGKKIAIVTNQAGVAFGYVKTADWSVKLYAVNQAFYFGDDDDDWHWVYCYGHPGAGISKPGSAWDPGRRKPSGKMIEEAMVRFDVSPDRTVMVGDMKSDAEAAARANVDYFDEKEFF